MAWSLHQRGVRVLAVCPGPSRLEGGPWQSFRLDQVDAAPTGLLDDPAAVLLVDDVDRLREHPVEALLLALGDDPHRSLVVAGTTASMHGAFRPLVALGRCQGTGVLLQPRSPDDGDVLGIRAELTDEAPPPGRGLLVLRGVQSPVQVAVPPSRDLRG